MDDFKTTDDQARLLWSTIISAFIAGLSASLLLLLTRSYVKGDSNVWIQCAIALVNFLVGLIWPVMGLKPRWVKGKVLAVLLIHVCIFWIIYCAVNAVMPRSPEIRISEHRADVSLSHTVSGDNDL